MADGVGPASDIVLDRLTRLHPKIIDLTLDRVWRLLDRVGNPQERLPPVVHVAGTNGKGSTVAILRAMAEAGRQRVHVYTSPHLVRFHERIRLAGRLIDEAELVALLEHCEAANGLEPITFFEVTTVAALLAFARMPADLLLLEVGLGGRLDATNVIANPALSIITPVSMDHMQYLGDSLEKIAFEKAGVLKPAVPAVIGPQDRRALAVIEARALAVRAPLLRAGREWTFECGGDALLFDGVRYPLPALPGGHQIANAATALAAARALREGLPGLAFDEARGLRQVCWPARLQRLEEGAHLARLPQGWELWLDGGHNRAAGEALGRQLALWSDRPLHVIYGLMNSKAAEDFLAPLLPHAASLQALAIPGEPNSLSAEAAAAAAPGAVRRASLEEALLALADKPGPARVLICGSLYLAGRVLAGN
ncbi:MAG: bifunctional folylpolyglutamate synthase/dihydrofolate synthase [Rhodospirillales bacterium]|nr:bifunctional folylpolyglutamate synthase/dihydrofolate synthase [Rhodospirillales bacterium]